MATNHSSSHAFNATNDTHYKNVATPTTYSWDVKNTHIFHSFIILSRLFKYI
jgi:hypothetical protein